MSARNTLNKVRTNKQWLVEVGLPNIDSKVSRQDFHSENRNNRGPLNRNVCSFKVVPSYLQGNFYSDISLISDEDDHFLSESDSGTPDIRSDGSVSSSNSTLDLANAAATRQLQQEWEKIERTLYDEDGDRVTQPNLIEECKQWKALFPLFRVNGKTIPLTSRIDLTYKNDDEETLAVSLMSCDSEGEFSEGADRKTESSDSDATPCNSPKREVCRKCTAEAISTQVKSPARKYQNYVFPECFSSLLQISPIYPKSPTNKGRRHQTNLSPIVKSEISSNKWLRPRSPDSNFKCDSAIALKTSKSLTYPNEQIVAPFGGRVNTARTSTRLQKRYEHSIVQYDNSDLSFSNLPKRNFSLPPLSNENKVYNNSFFRNKSLKQKKNHPKGIIQL